MVDEEGEVIEGEVGEVLLVAAETVVVIVGSTCFDMVMVLIGYELKPRMEM